MFWENKNSYDLYFFGSVSNEISNNFKSNCVAAKIKTEENLLNRVTLEIPLSVSIGL